jgi:glycerol kinase
LFNIHEVDWDERLLELFEVPRSLLPDVLDCADDFGTSTLPPLDGVPIVGVAGDQQAALIGQAGFAQGVTKSTYGTGCFVIANTGDTPRRSANQLLTTIASRIDGQLTYGLEGSVFVAGSAIQWLRDELRIIRHAADTQAVAEQTGVVDDVFVVPAFAGLGAPYWDPHARGAILGLSRGSTREQIVTATLQAIAFQTLDLMRAMAEDGVSPAVIRVDGGMVANDWFLQFLADVLDIPVERPASVESTVQGAGWLAAYRAGLIDSLEAVVHAWSLDRRFEPSMDAARRSSLVDGWLDAVARVRVP